MTSIAQAGGGGGHTVPLPITPLRSCRGGGGAPQNPLPVAAALRMAMALPPIPMGGIGDPQPPFFCPPPHSGLGGAAGTGALSFIYYPSFVCVRACVWMDCSQQ